MRSWPSFCQKAGQVGTYLTYPYLLKITNFQALIPSSEEIYIYKYTRWERSHNKGEIYETPGSNQRNRL